MNRSFLPVEDITQDDLDNVADRAKDKILDKENVRSLSIYQLGDTFAFAL